ncbi:hypothetical protein C8R43DRAFT_714478 [Mycena crocata]|nr:hypothetical protein C8R43DRAFT_714478 [Mycena crocata]
MHQAEWMRFHFCRPAPRSTRPVLPCIRFLSAHLVRDNFSLHRRSILKTPEYPRLRNEHRRPQNAWRRPDSLTSLKTAPVSLYVPRAESRNTLYKNLLRLLSSRRTSSLPVLLDYHELHHGLRSAKTYNLLISLAIRHVAYGTVQSLFNGMAADTIPENRETLKLKTRWFVRSGLWNQAWLQVTATHPKHIPLDLWLEFFHGVKLGGVVHRSNPTSLVPPQTRFQVLMQNLPTFMPNEVQTSVRAVGIVVRAMLSLNRPHSAFTLTTRYFNGLPRHVDVRWAEKCVDIINGLVAFDANGRGLLSFYSTRRKLNSLLALHPSFRPTPKTLYLLLGTLRQEKQCGTGSWHTLAKFKARWGPQVENRRVRRRVASYAIIERRFDIFNKVFDAEQRSRLAREAGNAEQPQLPSRRMPFREIYPRHGHEQRLWEALKARAELKGMQLRAQKDKRAIEFSDSST